MTIDPTRADLEYARHVVDLSRLNLPLLEKVRDQIHNHPETHNQTVWARRSACGTAMCFAGWAAYFAGHDFDFNKDLGTAEYTTDDTSIARVAQDALGLISEEGYVLFYAFNNRADLDWLLHQITDGAIPAGSVTPRPAVRRLWARTVGLHRKESRALLKQHAHDHPAA